KEGVDVLYCFNRADKLAIQNILTAELENEYVDEFAEYRSNQSQSSSVKGYRVVLAPEQVQAKLQQFASRYDLDVADCKLTFFDLDSSEKEERRRLFTELSNIGIESYLDVKTVWLKKVLEHNGLNAKTIESIMKFRYGKSK
ncbi:unnamed protein product, partial [Didymodactylos carnosus]